MDDEGICSFFVFYGIYLYLFLVWVLIFLKWFWYYDRHKTIRIFGIPRSKPLEQEVHGKKINCINDQDEVIQVFLYSLL